jgi:GNAT superfamily N-acetyltransferase
MASERAFLIASVDAMLIAEPTEESRVITEDDLHGLANLWIDAYMKDATTIDAVKAEITGLLAGETGEAWRDAWLGIWEGSGPPVAAILCTRWRGMPYVAQVITAPSSRNQGYASSLMRQFAQLAQANGDTHVGIMLKHGNPAMGLVAELGFVEMFTPAGL